MSRCVQTVKRVEGATAHSSEEDMAVDAPANVKHQSDLDTLTVKKVDCAAFIYTLLIVLHKCPRSREDFMAHALQGLLWPENMPPSRDLSEPVYVSD